MHTNKAAESEAAVTELRCKLLDLQTAFEKEKQSKFDIVADMTRAYKSMKSDKDRHIEELKQQLAIKDASLAAADKEKRQLVEVHEDILKQKDKELSAKDAKMNEMAMQFQQMLEQTLKKMADKIVTTNEFTTLAADGSTSVGLSLSGTGSGGVKQPHELGRTRGSTATSASSAVTKPYVRAFEDYTLAPHSISALVSTMSPTSSSSPLRNVGQQMKKNKMTYYTEY